MTRSTFKVLFYLKRQSEKNGKVPVMGRITVNGTFSQFSCKLSVRPSLWDTHANKASGKSVEAQRINEKLGNIKTNIGKQYQRICDRDSYVTAEKVKNAWQGFGDDCRLLMQTFDEYLQEFKQKRVGKDRKASTQEAYPKQRNRLAAFLEYEYHVTDIPFKELNREFIEKYVVYLSTVRVCCSEQSRGGACRAESRSKKEKEFHVAERLVSCKTEPVSRLVSSSALFYLRFSRAVRSASSCARDLDLVTSQTPAKTHAAASPLVKPNVSSPMATVKRTATTGCT